MSPEEREAALAPLRTPEALERMREAQRTPKARARQAEFMRRQQAADPDWARKASEGRKKSALWRERVLTSRARMKATRPEEYEAYLERVRASHRTDEFRAQARTNMQKFRRRDPEGYAALRGRILAAVSRAKSVPVQASIGDTPVAVFASFRVAATWLQEQGFGGRSGRSLYNCLTKAVSRTGWAYGFKWERLEHGGVEAPVSIQAPDWRNQWDIERRRLEALHAVEETPKVARVRRPKSNTPAVRKSVRARPQCTLTFQGETLTIPGWSRRTGLPIYTIRFRVQQKWPVDRILTEPLSARPRRLYTYAGETHTVTEWARLIGVNQTTLSARLARGWPPERVFVKKKKKRTR